MPTWIDGYDDMRRQMVQGFRDEVGDDLKRFNELKKRFNQLHQELKNLHTQWKKLHEGPFDKDHHWQHDQLIYREFEILGELQHIFNSADQLICRNFNRIKEVL